MEAGCSLFDCINTLQPSAIMTLRSNEKEDLTQLLGIVEQLEKKTQGDMDKYDRSDAIELCQMICDLAVELSASFAAPAFGKEDSSPKRGAEKTPF